MTNCEDSFFVTLTVANINEVVDLPSTITAVEQAAVDPKGIL